MVNIQRLIQVKIKSESIEMDLSWWIGENTGLHRWRMAWAFRKRPKLVNKRVVPLQAAIKRTFFWTIFNVAMGWDNALIDSRLAPQKVDIEFCQWLGENGIAFFLVFTKADKQSRLKSTQNADKFRKALLEYFEEAPQHFITSAETQDGRDEILALISDLNGNFVKPDLNVDEL